ncbi:MAG: hypothetical protein ACE5GW_12415, partial [Planctomycetota bacterium]
MTPKPESSRGLALILVVLVLSALALIGTPFVISMKLQERGSVHTVAQERADLAALSARNHAVAHLFSTHPSREEGSAVIPLSQVRTDIEERGGTGGENGPEEIVSPKAAFDGLDELEIRFASRLALEPKDEPGEEPPSYPMRGWRDQILDVRVEDEQGKVNLNSALPNLLGNLFAGGHLSEDIGFEEKIVELPLDDTTSFPADEDPDTVDGVVIILNPLLFTMEAVSYRGKTDTHLTGCFRGEYLSGTWDQGKGSPVFDLRGLKIFLNRYYDLSAGELRTYRTPQSVREIADWSIIPYFLENMAVLGLNIRNMDEFGLTPEMLARAGLDKALLERKEDQFDDKEYRKARKELLETGLPRDALELLEKFRGKAAVIQAARFAREMEVGKKEMFAFSGVFESTIKKELKRLQKHARGYFPRKVT